MARDTIVAGASDCRFQITRVLQRTAKLRRRDAGDAAEDLRERARAGGKKG